MHLLLIQLHYKILSKYFHLLFLFIWRYDWFDFFVHVSFICYLAVSRCLDDWAIFANFIWFFNVCGFFVYIHFWICSRFLRIDYLDEIINNLLNIDYFFVETSVLIIQFFNFANFDSFLSPTFYYMLFQFIHIYLYFNWFITNQHFYSLLSQ